jgi:hypothetical protein
MHAKAVFSIFMDKGLLSEIIKLDGPLVIALQLPSLAEYLIPTSIGTLQDLTVVFFGYASNLISNHCSVGLTSVSFSKNVDF